MTAPLLGAAAALAWLAQAPGTGLTGGQPGGGPAPALPAPPPSPGPSLSAPHPAPTPRVVAVDPAVLRAALGADPPVDALRRAASALAAAEPERAQSLVTRARWAAWLPEIRLRADRRFGRTESLDLTGTAAEVAAAPVGVDTINDLRYECRATWDLARMVFNPDELQAQAQALRMAEARREIESLVIRLYFERRRLKAEALASDVTDMASRLRLDLRVQEIEAELDALTAGAFTRLRSAPAAPE